MAMNELVHSCGKIIKRIDKRKGNAKTIRTMKRFTECEDSKSD